MGKGRRSLEKDGGGGRRMEETEGKETLYGERETEWDDWLVPYIFIFYRDSFLLTVDLFCQN